MKNQRQSTRAGLAAMFLFGVAGQAMGQGAVLVGGEPGFLPQLFADELVKGAPVSAEITTRTVQQLYDGNRIIHEDKIRLYRDSSGRVRRESLKPDGQVGRTYFLSDVVAGQNYTVDPAAKVAFKMPSLPGLAGIAESVTFGRSEASGRVEVGTAHAQVIGLGEGANMPTSVSLDALPGQAAVIGGEDLVLNGSAGLSGTVGLPFGSGVFSRSLARGQTEVEPLGQSKLSGIRVEGTLRRTTYPIDVLGNEKPIIVEKRTWFAPELRMMLKSEDKDPRFGTIIYEAKVLSTNEPDKSLFVIPSDFRIKDIGQFLMGPLPP